MKKKMDINCDLNRNATANTYNNCGAHYQIAGNNDAAIKQYHRALSLNPKHAQANFNLATLYKCRGLDDRAAVYFDTFWRVAQIPPAIVALLKASQLPAIAESTAQSYAAHAELSRALDDLLGSTMRPTLETIQALRLTPPHQLLFSHEINRDIKSRWAQLIAPAITSFKPRHPNGTPQMGVVVTNGHEGVWIKSELPLLRRIDTDQLTITIFCSAAGAQLIAPHCGALETTVLDGTVSTMAQQLYHAHLDLLYFFEIGSDTTNYLLPFFRAAPLQMGGWGLPDTSGIATVDYYLAAAQFESATNSHHYSEELLLPETPPLYYPRPALPPAASRAQLELPATGELITCCQNLRKIDPAMDELFSRILNALPEAHILLFGDRHPEITQQLYRRLQSSLGKLSERLQITAHCDTTTYLQIIRASTIVLDSHPYSGVNTAFDAIAMGRVIITLTGSNYRSNSSAGLLSWMGMRASVVTSREEYVALTLKLCRDRKYRKELEAQINQKSPHIFENSAAVTTLQSLLLKLIDDGRHRAATTEN